MTSQSPKVLKQVCRNGAAILVTLGCAVACAQEDANSASSSQANSSSPAAASGASPTTPSAAKAWIVRDPNTGRLYQQQFVPVTVPVTRWEARTVEQTVYEPRVATQLQQVPQTTFVPNTQYVMQPKVAGWWNPFKQPVQTYQYVPVTNWVPQTQQVSNPVTTQQWVPRQQKVVVYQPVQTTEVRQQLVQTELPQPQLATTTVASAARQPFFRVPILAQQRVLPWAPTQPAYPSPYVAPTSTFAMQTPVLQTVPQTVPGQSSWQPAGQPASQPIANNSPAVPGPAYLPPPQYASNGLRPVANPRGPLVLPPMPLPRFPGSPYSAPLQTTTSVGATASRDTLQSGMQPTVLR